MLKRLSKDCNFKAVSAEESREDFIIDSFINGLYFKKEIHQRLLGNKTLNPQTAFDQARALEIAQNNSESYHRSSTNFPVTTSATTENQSSKEVRDNHSNTPVGAVNVKCYLCELSRLPRS